MFPTLFSIGNVTISTYGIFLAASILYGIFLVWRLSRGWELDEERVLDLTLVTLIGGLIGARLIFVLGSDEVGLSLGRFILIHKYPGFSFWGGLVGGTLTLLILAKRIQFDVWQAMDMAAVGFIGGLILSDIGCFFEGCGIGIPSNLFFALPVVGIVGKRIPVQLIDAILLVILMKRVWAQATHFHPRGKTVSTVLIYIGLVRLITESLRFNRENYFLYSALTILGLILFYHVTKRQFVSDLQRLAYFLFKIVSNSNFRKLIISSLKKSWYNQKIALIISFRNLLSQARRLNVYISHKNSKYY